MSTYAVSDLHGHLQLFNQINKFIKQEDTVYCLGDCGDRGPEPWETIKAVASNPQWKYMIGNHEHMLAGAMCEYHRDPRLASFRSLYYNQRMRSLLKMNGGEDTYNGWIADGADPKWIDFLLNLPYIADFRNSQGLLINMTHAGWTPENNPSALPNKFEAIWSREHFDEEPCLKKYDLIIHGHTPIPYLNSNWTPQDGAYWYQNNHKIDIDMGAFVTNTTVLLDLDTLDEHIFTI